MDPWRKAYAGQRLKIPATAWNAMLDAARAHLAQTNRAAKPPAQVPPHAATVLVQNNSGLARDRFDVLGIDGPLIPPHDNLPEYLKAVALSGLAPTSAHAGRFVILQEPLADAAIGRAWLDGFVTVRVNMDDEDHRFADPDPSDPTALLSAPSGSAWLLYVQPVEDRDDPNVAWCLARIGNPADATVAAVETYAKITEYAVLAPNRWTYGGTEQAWTGSWSDKADGITWTAAGAPKITNTMEANNTDTSVTPAVQGNGVNCGEFDDHTVTLQPIRGNPVVRVRRLDANSWELCEPNAVTVSCT